MKKVIFKLMIICICFFNLNFSYENVMADSGYSIRVNVKTNCITIYNQNNKPVKAMACSVGKREGATPIGTFYTSDKYRWRELFGGVYGQYATRICNHNLFHSVYYETKKEDALNYNEYNKLGTPASMGCIRLSVADAKWIYDNCGKNTKVTIVNSDTDALQKPKTIKLTANAKYPNWDPTDPSPNNPWKKEKIKFKLENTNNVIYIEDNLNSNDIKNMLTKNVKAYDIANNEIPFETVFDFSANVPGKYQVKYFAKDVLGNYGEVYKTVEVCQKIHIYLEGEPLSFNELPVLFDKGVTFIPVRGLFEKFGASVKWDNSKRTISAEKDEKNVDITITETSAKVDNNVEDLTIPIKIVNGKTFMPIKTLCELFDYDVKWNPETKDICIDYEETTEAKEICTDDEETTETQEICTDDEETTETQEICIDDEETTEKKEICIDDEETTEIKEV